MSAASGQPARARGDTLITIFGRRAVAEALLCPNVEVTDLALATNLPATARKQLTATARDAGVTVETVSIQELSHRSHQPRHDQGVCARIRLKRISEVESFVESLAGPRAGAPATVIALDGITNPQNIGMIVRSACAAGIDAMLWPLAGSPWIDGLVIKSSAATVFNMPIVRCQTLAEGLYVLKRAGFTIAGLDASGDGSLFNYARPHRLACVIGGETTGLSSDSLGLLDTCLAIPMSRGVESLNSAATATLVCFHVTRPD